MEENDLVLEKNNPVLEENDLVLNKNACGSLCNNPGMNKNNFRTFEKNY
ncbi:MAG: hypothetical protein GDA51_07315 [Ekhidna sp.]|nr:hypothetical protein [Ekhidna sp.]